MSEPQQLGDALRDWLRDMGRDPDNPRKEERRDGGDPMTHPAPPSTPHAHITLARWLRTVPAGAVVTADKCDLRTSNALVARAFTDYMYPGQWDDALEEEA